ncbi:hypothetical protein AVEN_160013-1 [Araneus ventricosus]|uniref:ARL14 effector protein n=1 Tax=Araneus ventricosus TaxID=182803 RepID=A0A4Y2PYS4_ARAVE|nr:hypothetical protein AVEN_160013-1 [Araneus ventricosus]
MEKCSVGKFTHSDRHLLNYVNRKAIQAIEKLSETDLNLLKLRTDSNYELKTICLHHQSVFLKNYEFLQKVCCDPFKKHKTTIKKMLCVVTVEQSRIILYKGFKVKPGQNLCASCRNKLLKIKQIDESNVQNSLNTEDEDHDVEFTPAELSQKRNVIAELNSSFHEIGCTPMKLHALGEHSRSFYGKVKLQRVHETVKEKIQNVLEVDLPEEKNDMEKSVIKKSEDLDKLVDIIKNELSGTSRRKQIPMLTIPASLM